jgi:hypothetical protein
MRFFDFEPGFLEPTKIGHARIVKKRLTFSEPAPDPSHSHLGIGTETERDHEYHREAGQGPSCPPGSILQMTTRCANARWIETDHEKGTVGHLAREFNHAGPCGQQIDRRW